MINLADFLKKSLQESSVKSYVYSIEKYKKANKNADQYDYQKVMQHIELLRKNYKASTIKVTLGCIKRYYDYLIEIGKRKDNPARSIKLRDKTENPIQLQDLLTEKELQSLLNPRKERYAFLAKRNKIIMSLLVHQGLRIGEIEKLKTTDIDLEKAFIQVTGMALTNNRNLPLKAEQIILLYEYINHDRNKLTTWRNDNNSLLLGKLGTPISTEDVDYLITTYQKQSKKRITATTIRQSVIANLFIKNNDLRVVQHFAGHKSPDTTEKYRQTGLNALKTAIEKLHPIK
jgi:integrase/recombinase XerD